VLTLLLLQPGLHLLRELSDPLLRSLPFLQETRLESLFLEFVEIPQLLQGLFRFGLEVSELLSCPGLSVLEVSLKGVDELSVARLGFF